MKPNRLLNEKSPYLIQHAYNPVDWYPWGEEAFEAAKTQQKPIFLSIGYSTCYWCHVMEREVFENEEIAELMNDSFINIKVDREERPDIDRVYMTALQALTGSGGWPMSMFLTPTLKPFYGATYLPPKAKYGRAGIEDIINEINKVWKDKKEDIIVSGDKILEALASQKNMSAKENAAIDIGVFVKCYEQCVSTYDEIYGGFGKGNKFPRPVIFNFLLEFFYHTKKSEAKDMVTYTLKKMYDGGDYDHIGGGFHRYSVDSQWRVPHFEKMLYDQAQLVCSYLDCYTITNKPFFLYVAEEILKYVSNKLTDESGAFYSAEDAESATDPAFPKEKEEGAFNLWEKSEIDNLLGDDADIFNYHFGVLPHGNTLNDPHEVFGTKNVLYNAYDIHDTAKHFGLEPEEVLERINKSIKKLYVVREQRPKPHLDDKILTSWNALMISAYAYAYKVTKNKSYLDSANNAKDFIQKYLLKDDFTLLHRYRDGEARFEGTLEDYSYFIKALIDLYEAGFDEKTLQLAIDINNKTTELFYDDVNGGYFDVRESETDIVLKTKDTYDGAEPGANSIQLQNILRLSVMTDDAELWDMAEKSLKLFSDDFNRMPFTSPQMLCALNLFLNPVKEIIFTGDLKDEKTIALLEEINKKYNPNKVVIHATEKLSEVFPYVKEIIADFKEPKVYICENYKCNLPVDNVEDLKPLL